MDYKNTLNLPKTDFPMKADLPKREPVQLEKWLAADIYGLIRKKFSRAKHKYILHDGPPYANGDIHIGHALNKILKDIIIKYKTLQGYDCVYVPGWDCHGLPIEHQLFKELNLNKSQINQLDFRKKAYDYAMRFVATQKEQFKRLGVFGDWENPYLTLTADYEESIIRSFNELVKKGYIYRGLKPVNWCFKCETALAEAEVEYDNHTSDSIYVKFKLEQTKDYSADSYLLIWTTTPWTLLANVAVSAHPDFIYAYIKTAKGNLIIAKDLLESVLAKSGIDKYEIIREIKGKDLEGLIYTHPFGLRSGRVVLADYVSREEGTGLVHTAPGHGNEDYITGKKYNLEIIMPVDEKGAFDASSQEFSGLNIFSANKLIIEKLQNLNALLFHDKAQHSYPHCWRCKTPIIFRATKQWFLDLNHNKLRNKLLQIIQKDVRWIPLAGKERISAMVELRPDWCLSRQRYWGVPIPAIVCSDCKEEFLEPKVIEKFAQIVAKEGSDSWLERDIKDFLTSDIHCPNCKGKNFTKGKDILDVWFDSGVSHQAVLKKRKELGGVPAQMYLEGSDQHRGWFQSSLIPAVCIEGKASFENVLTHGFVVDGDGRKMSKSLGNVISPQDIIKDFGADILRLWVASSDYNEDIRISPVILSRLAEAYRKIRNTARFALSNLYDFNPDIDKVSYEKLKKIDQWILFKLEVLIDDTRKAYEDFEFYRAFKLIYEFCNMELSMFYLDMAKGRLYTFAKNSPLRKAAQTAIYEILNVLVRLIAPICVFTAEEVWQHMPKEEKDKDILSVHLLSWPQKNTLFSQEALVKKQKDIVAELKPIMDIIPDIAKSLEEKRGKGEIGSSFDAKIYMLTNNDNHYKFLESLAGDLCEIFKVSQVKVEKVETLDSAKSTLLPDIAITIDRASGVKCLRCWNYSETVGEHKTHGEICQNCIKAIGGK